MKVDGDAEAYCKARRDEAFTMQVPHGCGPINWAPCHPGRLQPADVRRGGDAGGLLGPAATQNVWRCETTPRCWVCFRRARLIYHTRETAGGGTEFSFSKWPPFCRRRALCLPRRLAECMGTIVARWSA